MQLKKHIIFLSAVVVPLSFAAGCGSGQELLNYKNSVVNSDDNGVDDDDDDVLSSKKLERMRNNLPSGIISSGEDFSVAADDNGNVWYAGADSELEKELASWNGIVSVVAGSSHVVGLRSDGTVVSAGDNSSGQADILEWEDVSAVFAGFDETLGLKSNGTLVATGNNDEGQLDIEDWEDIISVAVGESHVVGLKSDGTVVASGNNSNGQCDVADWEDIVAVAAGQNHTIGLKSDGTVVAAGDNSSGACSVSRWYNIVSISAGYNHTVALNADGTVVVTKIKDDSFDEGQGDTDDWEDIIAISAGKYHTLGLTENGTLVAVGENDSDQCSVDDFESIRTDNDIHFDADDAYEETETDASSTVPAETTTETKTEAVTETKTETDADKSSSNDLWKQLYQSKLNEEKNNYATFDLAYIDSDNVPELVLSTGASHADGCTTYTVKNGKLVKVTEYGGFYGEIYYQEKKGIILHSDIHQGYSDDEIYKMNENTGVADTIATGSNNEGALSEDQADQIEYILNNAVVTKEQYQAAFLPYWSDESINQAGLRFDMTSEMILDVFLASDPVNYVVEEQATTNASNKVTGKVTTEKDDLNVRSGPGESYEKIGSVAKGGTVIILDYVEGWYEIEFNDSTGYVSADYIKLN